jgi:A/G-specific adenine glycosylase
MRAEQRARILAKIEPLLNRRKGRIQRSLISWQKRNGRSFPWRDPGKSPYFVLLSELLLKRTTSKAVAAIFPTLVRKYPTLDSLLSSDLDEWEEEVAILGLRKQRRKALASVIQSVREKYHGELPSSLDELLSIPHIGPYSAGAIASFGFGLSAPLVDSNVERIFKRLFRQAIGRANPDMLLLLEIARRIVPANVHAPFNYGLLDLGALVCRHNRPKCEICPLASVCDTGSKNLNMKTPQATTLGTTSN